ncbi:hypothetical protein BJ912DRAFT_983807 [Pholiota molesta]|nr:hypothetical protein BJ912DRAFT_983807 [Pholiota molesta]
MVYILRMGGVSLIVQRIWWDRFVLILFSDYRTTLTCSCWIVLHNILHLSGRTFLFYYVFFIVLMALVTCSVYYFWVQVTQKRSTPSSSISIKGC